METTESGVEPPQSKLGRRKAAAGLPHSKAPASESGRY
jgi:hypothetical protein